MFITLNFESEIPIYEQLKSEIIVGIASNQITKGERLPSVRAMARDIGINLHTVSKAYTQLKDEGYLLIHRQRGVVVNPDGPAEINTAKREQLHTTLKPLIADTICRHLSHEEFIAIVENIYIELEEGDNNE